MKPPLPAGADDQEIGPLGPGEKPEGGALGPQRYQGGRDRAVISRCALTDHLLEEFLRLVPIPRCFCGPFTVEAFHQWQEPDVDHLEFRVP